MKYSKNVKIDDISMPGLSCATLISSCIINSEPVYLPARIEKRVFFIDRWWLSCTSFDSKLAPLK